MDALRKAYTTLELGPEASARQVRRQFRKLVRRWHPDRFARDPRGQAEAAERMRNINAAYQLIRAAGFVPGTAPTAPAAESEVAVTTPRDSLTTRLRRSAIEGIVRSIGTESPLDVLLNFLAWSWPLFLALLISPPRYQWLRDELAGRPHSPVFVWQLLLVALAVFLRLRQRRSRGKDAQ